MKKSKEKNQNDLRFCRLQVSQIDDEVFQLLVQGFELAKTIGQIKRDMKLPTVDNSREKELVARIVAKYPGLDEKFIKKLYALIFQESRTQQRAFGKYL